MIEFAEPERLGACPNCGQAPLPPGEAQDKLKALSDGAKLLRNKLSSSGL